MRDSADWLSRENAQQSGLPAEAVEALFGDDVFKKKHNSDLITAGDTTWVLRATETRAESVPAFEQAKEQVRAAYLNSEAAKAAEAQGKKLLAELQKGGTPQLEWSSVETLTAADARLRLPPQALSALAKARPAQANPPTCCSKGCPRPCWSKCARSKCRKPPPKTANSSAPAWPNTPPSACTTASPPTSKAKSRLSRANRNSTARDIKRQTLGRLKAGLQRSYS